MVTHGFVLPQGLAGPQSTNTSRFWTPSRRLRNKLSPGSHHQTLHGVRVPQDVGVEGLPVSTGLRIHRAHAAVASI